MKKKREFRENIRAQNNNNTNNKKQMKQTNDTLRHIPEGVRCPAFGIIRRRTSLEESCKNHIVKKQKFASSFETNRRDQCRARGKALSRDASMVNLFRLHWDTEIVGSFKQSRRWRERER